MTMSIDYGEGQQEINIETGSRKVKVKCKYADRDKLSKISTGRSIIDGFSCYIVRAGARLACSLCGSKRHLKNECDTKCNKCNQIGHVAKKCNMATRIRNKNIINSDEQELDANDNEGKGQENDNNTNNEEEDNDNENETEENDEVIEHKVDADNYPTLGSISKELQKENSREKKSRKNDQVDQSPKENNQGMRSDVNMEI